MAAYIQRPDGTALYFDLTYDEHHTGEAMVTKLPVEDGPSINDHIRAERSPFKMRCHISNAPLENSGNQTGNTNGSVTLDITPYKAQQSVLASVASAIVNPVGAVTNALAGDPGKKVISVPVLLFGTAFDAVVDALFILRDIQENGELLTVFTSVAEYEDMVLERFDILRNYDTGTGADIELSFVPLNIVTTQTAPTPITTEAPAAEPVKKLGKKDPEDPANIKSVAANGYDAAFK